MPFDGTRGLYGRHSGGGSQAPNRDARALAAAAYDLLPSNWHSRPKTQTTSESPPVQTNSLSPAVPPLDGIKLHIGGWEKREGWTILDALPGPIVDHVGNCTDLSFLPDASCSEVYASHVFEHLGYNGELQKALQGVHRVLKPGGRLRVSVPDLETLCKVFLHPSLDGPARFHVMRMMFGGRTTDYDVHYVGLTFEFLGEFLHHAGFRDIKRVPEFGLFQDTSSLRFASVLISLNVEARK
jgi:predicted SAM-dependent methyltransferase